MTRATRCWAVSLLAITAFADPSAATRTRYFRIEGAERFSKAKMSGVSVTDDGTVAPGPSAISVAPDAGAQVWSLVRTDDGNFYAGTGSDGAVYRIRAGRLEKAADLFEYEAFTVVQGKDGRIFASGAPNGTVSEILPNGEVRTLFDTPEKIVWSLLAGPDGTLYAATGNRGYVYRIGRGGEATVLYKAEDAHVTSLAWMRDGRIVASTGGRGLLIAIDPGTGRGRILYDASAPEIAGLAVAPGGEIYFAATGSTRQDDSAPAGGGGKDDPTTGVEPASVYQWRPDGAVRLLWRCPEERIHTLCLEPSGDLLAGTGEEAALYRVAPTGEATLLWRPEEGQVLALVRDGESIVAGTGNPGRIYRLGAKDSTESWMRPDPLDAGATASWGRAVWEILPGGGSWQIRTRSGHTEEPDSSWSEWSVPSGDADGSPVQSPAARFLQVEAVFRPGGGEGAGARLRRIWIPYSEPNLPPQVSMIRLSPDRLPPAMDTDGGGTYSQDLGGGIRVEFRREAPAPEPEAEEGPPPWVRDVRSITWDASDPNGDELRFDVAIRQVGEERFRNLAREHPVPAYGVDTATLPDGSYEVRVIASDALANPPGEGISVQRIGGPIRVDHRPPELVRLSAKRETPLKLVVEGTARDDASPIQRIEISWDGRPWRTVGALDGFLDSLEEGFRMEILLEREEEGAWVAARAFDAAGNETVRRAWLTP